MNLFVILATLAALGVNVAFSRRLKKDSETSRDKPTSEMCLSEKGSSYRGYVSVSGTGRSCLKWSRVKHPWGAPEGLGQHNYCRNPNQSLMPWCYVRKGGRIGREFCTIPKCCAPTPSPAVDTELTCGERSERRMHKIVGGSFVAIESQPWVAAIFHRRSGFLCGGSLIAPCWVLTAAHCFSDGKDTKLNHLSVYLGKKAINETDADREQDFTVEKLIIHQNFNASIGFDNDIALMRIKSKNGGCAAKSASSRTVCLPPAHTQLPAGFQCSVAGFGFQRQEEVWHFSQYLKQAEVKLISQTDCKSESYNGDRMTNNMICAASPDWSTDACKGDSGGPLVCEASGRMFLFGVVSWGDGCAKKDKPGVYTKVTNYNKWIMAKTGLSKYTAGIMYPQK